MKKVTLLALLLLSLAFTQSSNAAVPPVNSVTLLAQNYSTTNGSQIIVPIKVKDFQSIISCQGSIQFDTTVIHFVDVVQFGLSGMNSGSFGQSFNKITFSWFDNTLNGVSLTDSSTIFAIRFNVIGTSGQVSPIQFVNTPASIEVIKNVSGSMITLSTITTNGSVTVQSSQAQGSFKMMADTISVLSGSQVIVPIRAKYFKKIISTQGTLQFDPSVITYSSIQSYLPGMNSTNFGISLISSGKLTYGWSDPNLVGYTVADSTILFSVLFNTIGSPGTFSNISFIDSPTLREVVDSTFSPIAATYVNGKVNIISTSTPSTLSFKLDSINAPYNSQVLVPVRVRGFNNISTIQGSISFDPTKVSLVKTEQYGLAEIGRAHV